MFRWMLLLTVCGRAWCCSCVPTGPACEAVWKASAVFLGKLTELRYDRKNSDHNGNVPVNGFLGTHAIFEVSEPYAGMDGRGKQVEIQTGMGLGDCGFPFQQGHVYLVYAYENEDGRLVTSICSGTTEADKAAKDLTYLRSLKAGPQDTYIYGTVANGEVRPTYDKARGEIVHEGLAGAKVTLSDGTNTRSLTTGLDGAFRFSKLSAGTYYVNATKEGYSSSNSWLREPPQGTKLEVHANGCGYTVKTLVIDRRISGTVEGSDGKPAVGARIEVVHTKPSSRGEAPFSAAEARTDARGHYVLFNLRPGDYYLGINLARTPSVDMPYTQYFYPGTQEARSAQQISIGSGPSTSIYNFSLPDRQKARTVEGMVAWPDGKPGQNVEIFLEDPRWPWEIGMVSAVTDRQGHFSVQVFEKTQYRIHAVTQAASMEDSTSAKPVLVNGGEIIAQPVKLVLTEKGNSAMSLFDKGLERWRAGLGP